MVYAPLTVQDADEIPIGYIIPGAHQFTPRSLPSIARVLPLAQQHPLFYVSVYAAIGLSTALVNVLSTATQYVGGLRASRILFKDLLVSAVRATMRWHDTTPQGRMLNRFGKVNRP